MPADTTISWQVARGETSTLKYYNAALFNPPSGRSIPAAVYDTRSQAIIERPEDWECSVVRFDVSANSLPPMVLPMPGPPTVGANVPSSLQVVLRHAGVDYAAIVNIEVLATFAYGFMYSFDELTKRINAAFAAAFAVIPGPPSTAAPVIVFNPLTQLFVLYFQDTYVTAGAPIEIYVNSQLYRYILSMPAAFFGHNAPGGKDYRLDVSTTSAVTLPNPPGPGFPVVIQANGAQRSITQVAPSLASCNGVRNIFITTSMPINSESLPTSPGVAQNANTSSNSLPILTDFLLSTDPAANPVQDRISVSYLPTAEYRMIQMRGQEALNRIDMKFFFGLFDGSIQELYIPPGGYCSAKILFRRVRGEH